jgi:hypothetical protein
MREPQLLERVLYVGAQKILKTENHREKKGLPSIQTIGARYNTFD